MKTKIGIFAGLFVLVTMIGMSPSFADSNTTVISTNDGIQLTKTVVPMIISSDNTMPWGFIEGTVDNYAEGYPVIVQIYQNDVPIHFAQTDVNEDGTYEYKFFNIRRYTCFNNILSPYYISLNCINWIKFTNWNMFKSSSMKYNINTICCYFESIFISNISQKYS